MNRYKKLFSNTLIFGIGTFASKLLVFLLMPIYTAVLSEGEFGIADIVVQTANLLIPLVSIGITSAIIRFGLDAAVDKSSVFTVSSTVLLSGFGAGALIAFAAYLIFPSIGQYIGLVGLYVITSCVHSLCSQFVRSIERVKLFAVNGVLCTTITVLANLLFLLVFKMGVTGYILATVVADLSCACFLFFYARLYRYIKPKRFDRSLAGDMLRYCVPLIPTTVFWWITNVSDRYMVTFFRGEEANGLYAIAYKIPTVLVLLSTVFMEAWQMSAITEEQRERPDFFGRVFRAFGGLMFIGASGLIMCSKFLIRLLAAPAYEEAWHYMPVLICATVFSCFVSFMGTVYMVDKKSMQSLGTASVGAALNIVLNLAFIPWIGVQGAAVATLVSYLAIFVLRAVNVKKYIVFPLHGGRIILNTVLLLVQCGLMLWQPAGWYYYQIGMFFAILALNFMPLIDTVKRIFGK